MSITLIAVVAAVTFAVTIFDIHIALGLRGMGIFRVTLFGIGDFDTGRIVLVVAVLGARVQAGGRAQAHADRALSVGFAAVASWLCATKDVDLDGFAVAG